LEKLILHSSRTYPLHPKVFYRVGKTIATKI
jgi:hypothetical protein